MNEDTLQSLLEIYRNLYTYKHLLKDAPAITIDLNSLASDEIPALLPTIQQQTAAAVAYLLGLKELPDAASMLSRINQYYTEDDFWRRLLLTYVDVCQHSEHKETDIERQKVAVECKKLSANIDEYIRQRKDIVERFSKALDTQNFPIDSKRLFTNYLNMAEKDPENAWKLLMMSPAAFAPLKSTDGNGKVLISPAQAQKINKNIARFIKSLKA